MGTETRGRDNTMVPRGTIATIALFVLATSPALAGKKKTKKAGDPVSVCVTANVPSQPGGFMDPAVSAPFDEDLGNVRLFLRFRWRGMIEIAESGCQVSIVVEARGSRTVEPPADVLLEAGTEKKFAVRTVELTVTPVGGEPFPVYGHGIKHLIGCAKPMVTAVGGYSCNETGYWQVAASGAEDYVGNWIKTNYAALMGTARETGH